MIASDISPADHWQLRNRTLSFGKLPLLMGIINVTPDSFSDGGHCFDADAAVSLWPRPREQQQGRSVFSSPGRLRLGMRTISPHIVTPVLRASWSLAQGR
jgi:hypothetical protein